MARQATGSLKTWLQIPYCFLIKRWSAVDRLFVVPHPRYIRCPNIISNVMASTMTMSSGRRLLSFYEKSREFNSLNTQMMGSGYLQAEKRGFRWSLLHGTWISGLLTFRGVEQQKKCIGRATHSGFAIQATVVTVFTYSSLTTNTQRLSKSRAHMEGKIIKIKVSIDKCKKKKSGQSNLVQKHT